VIFIKYFHTCFVAAICRNGSSSIPAMLLTKKTSFSSDLNNKTTKNPRFLDEFLKTLKKRQYYLDNQNL
jgi:hypothetical protein